tara:strand:+ start:1453 stop:1968 length:516 start_codon:yes stop_codon:yes gene_type:complete
MKELDKEQLEAVKELRNWKTIEQFEGLLKQKGLLKEDFEVGKWYKSVYGTIRYFIDKNTVYGFSSRGIWTNEIHIDSGLDDSTPEWTLATDKEVEEALIKEAKKRGFKEGVKSTSVKYGCTGKLSRCCSTKLCSDGSFMFQGQYIFENGKWATIIEEKKEIVVNGITYIQK